jgi:hypothetical protein
VADVADTASYTSPRHYYGGGGGGGISPDHGDSGRRRNTLGPEDDTEGSADEPDAGDDADSDDDADRGVDDDTADDDTTDDGADDTGDGEIWTQPDEHRTGNDGDDDSSTDNDAGTDGDTGDRRVSMDIQAMTTLIAAMERARDQIPEYQAEFRKILMDVNLLEITYPEAERLPQVVAWIEDELPGLRRRLALAQALEDDNLRIQPELRWPQPRTPVVYDEDHVTHHPPHVSVEHGRELVTLLNTQPDQVGQLIAKLKGNQHDPYFAHHFTGEADPATLTAAIEAARSRDDVDPARVDELESLVRATVRTAARGTGELAPIDELHDRWGQFASGGAPSTT